MARKSKATPQPEPGPETEGGGQEGHGIISKSEAVRRALAEGKDQPKDGVAFIKDRFGLDIGLTHFSAVKSSHLKKQGSITVKTKGRPGRKPKEAAAETPSTEATPGIPANGEADLLRAMEQIKPLIASLGADKVRRIVDLIG